MNALFLGPYRQQDDSGLASQSYIKAIASQQKYNLTTRPIFLGSPSEKIDRDILEYENSLYDSYDAVIQQTLPHCLFYNGKFKKHIGCIKLDTNNISNSISMFNINQMDEIWVASTQEEKCLRKSGVTKSIKVISQPLDIGLINNNRDKELDLHPMIKQTFKFYYMGDYNERANLKDLITAFHLAFDINQPVSLIIKTNISNMSIGDSYKLIEKEIEDIKKRLNISHRYKKEVIITEELSYENSIRLHNCCDCFVSTSKAESFGRTAAEALVLGKTPIVPDNTGMIDFIDNKNGYIVQSHRTPVILDNKILPDEFDIYNANEYWYQVNIYDLIEKMRAAYSLYKTNKKEWEQKKELGLKLIDQFSYETIGKKLCI
jgi:glycosyltransferase involved in cell wall biosynthesis